MADKKTTRQRRILALLHQKPSARVRELADSLGVTGETIRRDLDDLTAQGLISRTYGGAVLHANGEPGLNERHHLMVPERERIARLACPLLHKARLIMIGSGATTVQVARRIAVEMTHLTVIAHSFGVATVLSLNPTLRVLMAPGDYHAGEGAVHGAACLRFLEDYQADWAVLGASGLCDNGPNDALLEAAEVYGAMIRHATQTLVVADHSKFARRFAARYAPWERIGHLVTDQAPTGALAGALTEAEVELHLA